MIPIPLLLRLDSEEGPAADARIRERLLTQLRHDGSDRNKLLRRRTGDAAGWDDLSPADWCWSDDKQNYRADKVKYSVRGEGWEPNKAVLDAMCRGLEKFNASGRFKGKLPREQMLITLFVQDPSYPSWAVEFAERINPKPASDWFKAVYPYAENDDADE